MVSTNNKLIAEFMKLPTEVFKSGIMNYHHDGAWYEEHELSYNVSWDWLMPVLKRITFKLNPSNYGEWRMINRPTEYNIEDSYAQAVRFIKKYNVDSEDDACDMLYGVDNNQ